RDHVDAVDRGHGEHALAGPVGDAQRILGARRARHVDAPAMRVNGYGLAGRAIDHGEIDERAGARRSGPSGCQGDDRYECIFHVPRLVKWDHAAVNDGGEETGLAHLPALMISSSFSPSMSVLICIHSGRWSESWKVNAVFSRPGNRSAVPPVKKSRIPAWLVKLAG